MKVRTFGGRIRTFGSPKNLGGRIGLKVKYSWNTPTVVPHLEKLRGRIDHFELGVRPDENYKDFNPLRKAGIAFVIHAPMQENGVNPGEKSKDDSTRKGLKWAQEAADYFDASVIVVHPGHPGTDDFSLEHMIEIFKEFAGDDRFHLENLSRTPWTISEMKKMREETGFKTCFDIGHALIKSKLLDRDAYEYIKEVFEVCPPSYFHLHNNDREIDRHWQITDPQGFIDYNKLRYLFNKNSFMTLEIALFEKESFRGDTFDIDGALRDVEFLRNFIK